MRILALILAIIGWAPVHAGTVFKNATVITMDGDKVLTNSDVRIDGDRIVAIGRNLTADNDVVIDATGKFLIPGLAELHGHLPSGQPSDAIVQQTLFLYLAGGVTTVRGMLGHPAQFDAREAIEAGDIAGPTLYLAAPSLNGNSVTSVQDGIEKVRKYHADGWDLLKIHPGLTRDEYDAIAETANGLGLPFGGHVPADVGIERALAVSQTSIDHIDGFLEYVDGGDHELTADELESITALYKRYKPSWLVPTQALFGILISGGDAEELKARPENKYMTPAVRANWASRIARINRNPNQYAHANRQKVLNALYKAGALIAMGSDAPQLYSVPGFSIWREVETMTQAGISAPDILAIGTRNAGDYFKDKDQFGTIAIGMRADILLLDNDPRVDATNLFEQSGVMAAGRWYSRADIDGRLAKIAEENK